MDFSNAYLEKVAEDNVKLKGLRLPLLSFDIHLRNIYKQGLIQQDLNLLNKTFPNLTISENIIDQYVRKKAVLVITDLSLHIQFATTNILQMTGFKSEEVLGKSPKMFQGRKTNKAMNKRIRKCVSQGLPFHYVIINYKKDKSTYKCDIKAFPLKNKKGEVVNYIAIEKEVA